MGSLVTGRPIFTLQDRENRNQRRIAWVEENRENIFQLLFMTEFNDGEAMNEQQRLYLEGIEDLKEKDRIYIQEKFQKINEKIPQLDERLNETSKGWKTSRMNKVDLTILRLAFTRFYGMRTYRRA